MYAVGWDDSMASESKFDVKRFNRWAATYDQSWAQRWYFGPVHSAMISKIAGDAVVDAPKCILDVGCGTGRLLRTAAKSWPLARLVGVDPAEHMVAEARRLTTKADFHVAHAEELPIPDATVDLALTSVSFHHWQDQPRGLQEIVRVLVPGGRLCLADHVTPGSRLLEPSVRSLKDIKSLMRGAGLEVLGYRRLWARFMIIVLASKK